MKWLKKLFGKEEPRIYVTVKRTPEVLYGSIGEAFASGAVCRYPDPTHKITYDVDQDGNVLFCKMEELK